MVKQHKHQYLDFTLWAHVYLCIQGNTIYKWTSPSNSLKLTRWTCTKDCIDDDFSEFIGLKAPSLLQLVGLAYLLRAIVEPNLIPHFPTNVWISGKKKQNYRRSINEIVQTNVGSSVRLTFQVEHSDPPHSRTNMSYVNVILLDMKLLWLRA